MDVSHPVNGNVMRMKSGVVMDIWMKMDVRLVIALTICILVLLAKILRQMIIPPLRQIAQMIRAYHLAWLQFASHKNTNTR